MPIYAMKCPSGHQFDEIFGSFKSADTAILTVGVPCHVCGKRAARNLNPSENMKTTNDLPKRYGIYTYGAT